MRFHLPAAQYLLRLEAHFWTKSFNFLADTSSPFKWVCGLLTLDRPKLTHRLSLIAEDVTSTRGCKCPLFERPSDLLIYFNCDKTGQQLTATIALGVLSCVRWYFEFLKSSTLLFPRIHRFISLHSLIAFELKSLSIAIHSK